MSKSGGTTKSMSSTRLPSFQQPYVQEMLTQAKGLYEAPGPSLYSGSFTAPFSLNEKRAQEGVWNNAFTPATEVADWTQQAFAHNLGPGRDPLTDPYFNSSVSSAVDPIFRNLTENVLPQIRGGYRQAGQPGGSRQSLSERGAVDVTTRNASEAANTLYSNAYNQAQQRALQTMSLGPELQASWFKPYEVLSGVGAQERAMQQALIDEERFRSDYAQNLPYTKLAEYSNLIRQPLGSEGTSELVAPAAGTASQIAAGAFSIPTIVAILRSLFGGG